MSNYMHLSLTLKDFFFALLFRFRLFILFSKIVIIKYNLVLIYIYYFFRFIISQQDTRKTLSEKIEKKRKLPKKTFLLRLTLGILRKLPQTIIISSEDILLINLQKNYNNIQLKQGIFNCLYKVSQWQKKKQNKKKIISNIQQFIGFTPSLFKSLNTNKNKILDKNTSLDFLLKREILNRNLNFFKLKASATKRLPINKFINKNISKKYSSTTSIIKNRKSNLVAYNMLLSYRSAEKILRNQRIFNRALFKTIRLKKINKKINNITIKNWLSYKIFSFYLKFLFLSMAQKIFFKLKFLSFIFNFQTLEQFLLQNRTFKMTTLFLEETDVPTFKYKSHLDFFSLIISFGIYTYNLSLIVEHLDRYLRGLLHKRLFLSHFMNMLNRYKGLRQLQAFCILLRGTVEKHGRTITYYLIDGKISLQTYSSLVYYDYIQSWQLHGVFGLHIWIRYPQLL